MTAINDEYPVLEYLIMDPSTMDESTALILPKTLQTPHLRHLMLRGFSLPVGYRLLKTAMGLVTLSLSVDRPSSYFQPNNLFQWISFMPQLEKLQNSFLYPVPNRDVERQLMHTPIMTHVTLPNLRWFLFQGVSAYLEAVVCRITAPRLENLLIQFFEQLTFSVPRPLQLMNTTKNLKFDSVRVGFNRGRIDVDFYPREEAKMWPLYICASVYCWHLDWQVSSVAQIFNSVCQVFSTVDHLTLYYEVHSLSAEEHNEVDRTEWRKLLGSFCNAKTLHVDNSRLVKELSRSLQLDDGEQPLELLHELYELTYSGNDDVGDAFTSFVDARQNSDRR